MKNIFAKLPILIGLYIKVRPTGVESLGWTQRTDQLLETSVFAQRLFLYMAEEFRWAKWRCFATATDHVSEHRSYCGHGVSESPELEIPTRLNVSIETQSGQCVLP
jgi:hypothetical protein